MAIYGFRPGTELGPPRLQRPTGRWSSIRRCQRPSIRAAPRPIGSSTTTSAPSGPTTPRSSSNAQLANTHAYRALLFACSHRVTEGQAAAARATSLEPDSAVVAYIVAGASFWMRDFENATRYTVSACRAGTRSSIPASGSVRCCSATRASTARPSQPPRARLSSETGSRCCSRGSEPPTRAPANPPKPKPYCRNWNA